MNDTELLRYSRHILLNELGVEGQQRLRDGRVLVLGAGGLGSPVLLYLASAGVGSIRVVDKDVVDLTNLQRQIIHSDDRIGTPKALSAAESMRSVNPNVEVLPECAEITADLLHKWVEDADVVVDCTDNFRTRFLVNAACVTHRRPLVSGAAVRFEGQLGVFDSRSASGPCYACLFPDISTLEEVRCSVMGVFAPLVGLVGAAQAMEALKLLSQCGESSVGRFLILDALTLRWDEVVVHRSNTCKVCSPTGAIGQRNGSLGAEPTLEAVSALVARNSHE